MTEYRAGTLTLGAVQSLHGETGRYRILGEYPPGNSLYGRVLHKPTSILTLNPKPLTLMGSRPCP